ncbi:MAG: thioredoxin-like domain-containing protein [Gemmataceae bacterium]
MKKTSRWLPALCSSLILATGAATAATPVAVSQPAPAPAEQVAVSPQEREVQDLLTKLSDLSNQMTKNPQDPQGYRLQLSQADVSLHLAVRSKGKERDDWLKMATDSLFTAAIASPENDTTARARLTELPAQILKAYPDSRVVTYAALQGVQADYMRALNKNGDDPTKAQLLLRDGLVRFVQTHPKCDEAPKAVMEAAELSISLGKKEDARRCYRYLADAYTGTPLGRKAEGVLWRMSEGQETIQLEMPLLYSAGRDGTKGFDLNECRGKVVVVYFWSQTSSRVNSDFDALKRLTDGYAVRGLEVVYVNLDDDPAKVQMFLSGRLLTGVHLHQRGGLESHVAERMGIRSLPDCFLIGRDGKLLRHSLSISQVETEVKAQMAGR